MINNLIQLKRLKKYNNLNKKNDPIKAILNIDTGMNRLGLEYSEVDFLYTNRSILENIKWDFIMSHLTNYTSI